MLEISLNDFFILRRKGLEHLLIRYNEKEVTEGNINDEKNTFEMLL